MSYSPSSNSKNIAWRSWRMGSVRDQYTHFKFTRVNWKAGKVPQNKLKHVLQQKYIFKICGGEEGKTQAYRGHVKRGVGLHKVQQTKKLIWVRKKKENIRGHTCQVREWMLFLFKIKQNRSVPWRQSSERRQKFFHTCIKDSWDSTEKLSKFLLRLEDPSIWSAFFQWWNGW